MSNKRKFKQVAPLLTQQFLYRKGLKGPQLLQRQYFFCRKNKTIFKPEAFVLPKIVQEYVLTAFVGTDLLSVCTCRSLTTLLSSLFINLLLDANILRHNVTWGRSSSLKKLIFLFIFWIHDVLFCCCCCFCASYTFYPSEKIIMSFSVK